MPSMRNALRWRQNERDGVSKHQPHDCLLNHLLRRRSKKTSKLGVTGLREGNSPVTGKFPSQRASTAEKFAFDDVIIGSHVLRSTKVLVKVNDDTKDNLTRYDFLYMYINFSRIAEYDNWPLFAQTVMILS